MCPAINNPASFEIRAVIHFLRAKSMSAAKIHRELCAVHGQNVICEGTVRQCCTMFKDGRINEQMFTMKSEMVGWPSVMNLVQSVDQNICERRRLTISEFSCEFPQLSRIVLYEIIIVRLSYHKFCARWVLKILTGAQRTQRIALAVTFLKRYKKDGDEFLEHIITGDESEFHL
jgi:hypothetical protein